MQCTPLLFLFLAVSVLCTPAVAAAAALDPPQPLAPFDYINYQLLDLDTGVKVYQLVKLKPNTGYEVRVSFPASVSGICLLLELHVPDGAVAHLRA
jgi:hypothetical protein